MRGLAAVIGSVLVAVTGAGCGGGGGGGKGGQGGGLSGLGGFGLVDGGPTDGGGSSGTDVPLTPAPPICGNGIVETGEACDGAARAACAGGQRCGAGCACVPGPQAPRDSGALIAAALAAGRIDYFTSLLYRAYRLVGDGRLPVELDGDLTVAEDSALFLEVSRLWGTLTSTQQQQLHPYVARPNDPASVYSTPPAAASFDDDLLAAPTPLECPPNTQTGEADWRVTETTHFVVWSCGTGDPTSASSDPYAGKRQVAAAIAEQVWAAEVSSMGPPRGDDYPLSPGDKSRIDVYLVPLNKCVRSTGDVCAAITSTSMIAGAVPDSPCDGSRGALTSSGYLLLRLDLVPDAAPAAGAASKARSDFAHEFFHLLTFGLNLDAQGGGCRDRQYTGGRLGRTSWLTEASATWAEWAYTPTDNPEFRELRFGDFQKHIPEIDSLLDNDPGPGDNPAYHAFVYPLFLSQEAGGRMPFEDFWKTARAPRTREALDDALNTRFQFARHFRDFAVKMFNMTLTPGDPIAPLLGTFDDAVPVDFAPVNLLEAVDLPEQVTDLPFRVTLAPLAAQYQAFSVGPTTRWVDIDLSGAGADLTMDALVNVGGRWSRRSPNGLRFTFCRDLPEDDIQELYLVIANVAHDENAKADEDYKIKTRTACPASLTGWIRSENSVEKHYINVDETVDQFEQTRETWSLGMQHDMDTTTPFPTIDAHWHAIFAHHESVVRASCQYTTVDGENGGSAVTPLAIMEPGNGQLILAPFSPDPGHFDVEMVTHYEMCDGNNLTTNSMRTVYEQLATVSGFVQLTPLPQNPDRYIGSKVITHSEQPLYMGTSVVDWKISWDITRNRR